MRPVFLFLIAATVLLRLPTLATAQQLIEDSEGESPIVISPFSIDPTSLFSVNSSNTSIKFRFVNDLLSGGAYIGLDVEGRATNDLATLFSGGNVGSGARIQFNVGKYRLMTTSLVQKPTPKNPVPAPPPHGARQDTDWLNVAIGFEGSRFALYDPSLELADQIRQIAFNGARFELQYSYFRGGALLVSATTGIRRTNNERDLDEVEVEDSNVVTDGQLTRSVTSTLNAKTGAYEVATVVPLRLDVFWQLAPQSKGEDRFLVQRLGLAGFIHSGASGHVAHRATSIGGGLYILKKDSPAMSLGALIVEVRDVFDVQNTRRTIPRRLAVTLIANIPFSTD